MGLASQVAPDAKDRLHKWTALTLQGVRCPLLTAEKEGESQRGSSGHPATWTMKD
jgi:hypothetical protein